MRRFRARSGLILMLAEAGSILEDMPRKDWASLEFMWGLPPPPPKTPATWLLFESGKHLRLIGPLLGLNPPIRHVMKAKQGQHKLFKTK
jgi:hypothetical protein